MVAGSYALGSRGKRPYSGFFRLNPRLMGVFKKNQGNSSKKRKVL